MSDNQSDSSASPTAEAPLDPSAAFQKANGIILTNVAISAGIGLVPIPLFDISAMLAQQLLMIRSLGNVYGQKFSDDLGRKALFSLLGATLPSTSLKFLAFSLLKSIPLVGSTASAMTMPLMTGAMTYAVGKVFNLHFASGGSYLSFDPQRYRDHLQKEMKVGMQVADEAPPVATTP